MSQDQLDRSFRDDVAWCYDAVQDVSRTFSLTIAELDEPMAREICVGYLLCRIADTIEDAGHLPPDEQASLLRLYGRVIDPEDGTTVQDFLDAVRRWIPDQPDDDWAVVENAERVVAAFRELDEYARQVIRPPVLELIEGMAMFVERYAEEGGLRLRTLSELEEYCWYAAGTVGQLVTGLVTHDADEAVAEHSYETGRSFALLLQLVNVAKDVARDFEEENNVYLPLELLREYGVDPEQVADEENAGAVARVVGRVTNRAEGYLDDAQAWLETMPETRGNTLSAWAIPYLLAVGTLRELDERPEDVVREGNVKVPRSEVRELLARFGRDDPSVAELRAVMHRRPLDEA